ncbi:MAG: hypothetical protein M3R12_00280, partial [Actinomycetota bacterium]|nr:hypothetical protein [Actinomycetota bacterium]
TELATLLSRRETHPRRVARLLAVMAGVPRRQRAEYVEETLRLALGDDFEDAVAITDARRRARQVRIAAALDPFANVLVVDELPPASDEAFRRRCLRRISESLERGAAVVIACEDEDAVLQLCRRVVRLEEGTIVEIGPAEQVLAPKPREVSGQPVPEIRRKGFDAHAAILWVDTRGANGRPAHVVPLEEEWEVRVHFETARDETTVVCRVRLIASSWQHTFAEEPTLVAAAGRHVAVLRVPAGRVPEGDHTIRTTLLVTPEHGKQAKLVRDPAAHIRVEPGDEDGRAFAAETGAAPSPRDSAEPTWTFLREA